MDDRNETAQFVTLDGQRPLRAYGAEPETRANDAASIVMAMHLWGVDAKQRDAARRFAAAGFRTIIPDLYARFGTQMATKRPDARTFLSFDRKLEPASVDLDLRAAAAWLRARDPKTRTAIVGFCMDTRDRERALAGPSRGG